MKLNQDCIRDLLLYLEENLNYNVRISVTNLNLNNYSFDDLFYTTEKLIEAGFINCSTFNSIGSHDYIFKSITYLGHQYLDTIRDDGIWKETKKKLSKVTSASLPIVQEVASAILKSTLGLPQ